MAGLTAPSTPSLTLAWRGPDGLTTEREKLASVWKELVASGSRATHRSIEDLDLHFIASFVPVSVFLVLFSSWRGDDSSKNAQPAVFETKITVLWF